MTDAQLAVFVGFPLLVNTTVVLFVFWALSARVIEVRDTVRNELRRIEEISDARLKRFEGK